ncbi:Suf-domain-containing protein [Exidia glandulosa HHB12029]|uniref:mRNA 3'-end-processing protein RNA14 n=1 Tax=Exidia glandulosa HHB12029 TaxID=1314781 RepID=A0A165CWA4_EXIGL|nr:Suf-domain-containing protein [Exidia glandulosa HHB12029]
MEYHCTKATDVATRIFQNGMNLFANELEFVDRYLAFLISINDESNARALFERVAPNFVGPKGRMLWERWGRYEYQYGDLEAVLKFEKRFADAFKEVSSIKRFADRHKYGVLDAIASRDLGVGIRTRVTRSETNATSLLHKTGSGSGNEDRDRRDAHSPDNERERDRKRPNDGPSGGPLKRARPMSPPPGARDRDRDRDRERERERDQREREMRERERERDMIRERDRERDRERELRDRERERWDRKRPASPPYRNGSPARRPDERDRDDGRANKGIPPAVTRFLSTLPAPQSFDGPIFRTDDLMQLFRNAAIPAPSPTGGPPMGPPRARSPPAPRGRPPPDYGPYTGPGGGARRGRF